MQSVARDADPTVAFAVGKSSPQFVLQLLLNVDAKEAGVIVLLVQQQVVRAVGTDTEAAVLGDSRSGNNLHGDLGGSCFVLQQQRKRVRSIRPSTRSAGRTIDRTVNCDTGTLTKFPILAIPVRSATLVKGTKPKYWRKGFLCPC